MFKIIFGIILGILCVVFFIQNAETVTFIFLGWEISMSRALMLITVLTAGIIIGWILSSFKRTSRRKK